jgi:hypothetical protein
VSQILVNTGELFDRDLKPRLFQHLAPNAVLESFVEFENTTGGFPMAVIVAFDHQDAAVVANHDAGDVTFP